MKNQSTPVLKVSLLLLFLIAMIPSCTKDLNQTTDDPYSSPTTSRYTTKSTSIDINLLSQLRQDFLYNEFISRTSYSNTKELIDSLKYYSQNNDTSAYNHLSTQQQPVQQQNREDKLLLEQKYKVSINNYLIYEYNQGRQLRHKATKANSDNIIIRHPEGLVCANRIIREFGITYGQGISYSFHSKCNCYTKGQYLGFCIQAALQYMGTCSPSSYRAFEAIKDASDY